jgi:hypothetical protein
MGFSGELSGAFQFSFSRRVAETGDRAGFLANGSLPGISPSPRLCDASGGRLPAASAKESGFPITVAGPRGNYTHFPFTPIGAPQSHFRDQKRSLHIPPSFRACQKKAVASSQYPVQSEFDAAKKRFRGRTIVLTDIIFMPLRGRRKAQERLLPKKYHSATGNCFFDVAAI